MAPTAFCSMWISNTATTAMMIPIIEAVLDEIEEKDQANDRNQKSATYGTFEENQQQDVAQESHVAQSTTADIKTQDIEELSPSKVARRLEMLSFANS